MNTDTSSHARLREQYFGAIALGLYVLLSLIKMRAYAADGRFWAEEGAVFLNSIADTSLLDGIFFSFNAHLELVTNLVMLASMLVDFKYAPLVSTWTGYLLQSIPVAMIILFRTRLTLTRGATIAVILILTGLPQAAEVWANATNLHFHFALLAAVIALINAETRLQSLLFRFALVISSLSGIPANFLAPVYLGLALHSRDRERWIQFAILVMGTCVQLGFLVVHDFNVGQRQFTLNPVYIWLPILSQQLFSPLFGIGIGDTLASILKEAAQGNFKAILFAIAASLPIIAAVRHAYVSRSRFLAVLLGSMFMLTACSALTALGDKSGLISATFGGRYFFAPNVLAAMGFCAIAIPSRNWILYLVLGILLVSTATRLEHYLEGPDWQESYENAMRNGSSRIEIWPKDWYVRNFQLEGR